MKVLINDIIKVKNFVSVMTMAESDALLKHDLYCVDAKSVMGILSLDISKPLNLEIIERNPIDADHLIKMLDSFGLIYNGD